MQNDRKSHFSLRIGARWFAIAIALICAIALTAEIAELGFMRIINELEHVGFGLLGIILVHILQLLSCALGWRVLLSPRPVRSNLRAVAQFLKFRWIRESIDSLLPVAHVGGEVAAARLFARQGSSLPLVGASIIADVTIEILTQAVFTLIGLTVLFTLVKPGEIGLWASVGLGVASLMAGITILVQRQGGIRVFERILLAIADRTGWNQLEGVAGLDAALSQVYMLRSKLYLTGFYHLLAWSLGTGEVMIAARGLGFHTGVGQAYVIESLAQAIRSASFFVPGAIGVQEGGFIVLAGLFGIPADAAISISFAKRVRELVLGLPGLAIWQWLEIGTVRNRQANIGTS